ncbi:FkbM family methyltransferase, partial [Frankia sp. AgB1.8]|uniref:FkbM family methyltransferase n=1 Tax=Frankia sp. AgB1.8 TaxID=2792839 RepID=UPI001EE42552
DEVTGKTAGASPSTTARRCTVPAWAGAGRGAGAPAHATAVIVHWGRTESTARLAARLDQMSRIDGVVVVANDGAARPAGLPATIEWLVPHANLGFAGGFRLGAAARQDSHAYLLVNNDVWLPERTLGACLDLLAHDGVGIVGPTLLDPEGIHPAPERPTALSLTSRRRHAAGPNEPADVPFVTRTVLLIRAECHRQVPMDTRYFLGYEDADLAWRARAAGWRVIASRHQAWHTGGGVMRGDAMTYFTTRNRIWFARAHQGRSGVAGALWLALGTVPRSAGSDLLRGRGLARCRFAWHGLLDGIGPLPPADRPFPDEPRPTHWERTHRARTSRSTSRRATSLAVSPTAAASRAGQARVPTPSGASWSGGLAGAAGRGLAKVAPGWNARYAMRQSSLRWLRGVDEVVKPMLAVLDAPAVPASVRSLAERATHRLVLRRRLPAPYNKTRIYTSSEAGLKHLRGTLTQIDPVLIGLIRETVRPGAVVWDIGSNVGLSTFAAATAAGPSGHVLAVEPDTWLVGLLRRSAALPGDRAPVEVLAAAVGDVTGIGQLCVATRNRATSHLAGFGHRAKVRTTIPVPTVTLDDLLSHAPAPDVLKIDIEGAELLALAGAHRVLAEARPTVICAVAGANARRARAMLAEHGYQVLDGELPPASRVPVPAAPWTTLAIPVGARPQAGPPRGPSAAAPTREPAASVPLARRDRGR